MTKETPLQTTTQQVKGWYNASLGSKLGAPARELLETYSHIPASEVEAHVYSIVLPLHLLPFPTNFHTQRDAAWKIWPYPCIGQFRFLDLSISQSPYYTTLLSRLKTGEKFLDLGCCFGQDIRKLVADGAPAENLYGSDLRPEFFALGYELFRDREKLASTFLVGDVFDPSSELARLDGQLDVVHAASFLHLFCYEDQIRVCVRIVKLLRERTGSVVLGRQIGHLVAGEQAGRLDPKKSRFRHNEESFKDMWREVGELTGSRWRVEVEVQDWNWEGEGGASEVASSDKGMIRLRFVVFRV